MSETLCLSLLAKVDEQFDRLIHLAHLFPDEQLDQAHALLLGHMLDCAAGFCAALYASAPDRFAALSALRTRTVNAAVSAAKFETELGVYRSSIRETMEALTDSDLGARIPTVFVPEGETLLTLLLGNLEHLINHKRELFGMLKTLGVKVSTPDLYRLRGSGV